MCPLPALGGALVADAAARPAVANMPAGCRVVKALSGHFRMARATPREAQTEVFYILNA